MNGNDRSTSDDRLSGRTPTPQGEDAGKQGRQPVSDDLVLPSAGPEPLTRDSALAAVLGYARGRRPLYFRSPNARTGRWVSIPAFGYERFDRRPVADDPLGEADILVAEGVHGRLDPAGWDALKQALDDVRPLADTAVERAAGRPFWELPDDEFSRLAEPATVGAALREVGRFESPQYVTAALHHRRPALFPHLSTTTRRQLFPHVDEADSGVEAVVHRELRANAAAFARLETDVATLLGHPLTRLRLHDVLLWLSTGLRLAHAVELGRATDEWRRQLGGVQAGSRPV
jgi:hypothetical protein